MKRTLMALLVSWVALSAFSQSGQLIGNWGTADKSSRQDVIFFRPDKTAVLHAEGRILEVEEYRVKTDSKPWQIELRTKIEGSPVSIYLLVDFLSGDLMKMEIFPPGSPEPMNFSEDSPDTQMILTRISR